jgi:hypothetical protein
MLEEAAAAIEDATPAGNRIIVMSILEPLTLFMQSFQFRQ